MALGPVQLMVVGFDHGKFTGEILPELERLADGRRRPLVDLMFVDKDDDGNITAVQLSDLTTDEAMEWGAIAGALVGFGVDGEEGAEAGALAGAEAGARTATSSMSPRCGIWPTRSRRERLPRSR